MKTDCGNFSFSEGKLETCYTMFGCVTVFEETR